MSNKIIKQIKVKNLFGLYTYSLPEAAGFSGAAILYGDNGVGKSTILRLAFHLLSAARDRGHRTALYKAKFDSLEIELISGHTLSATFEVDGAVRFLSLLIRLGDKILAGWQFAPKQIMAEVNAREEIYTLTNEGMFLRRKKSSTASRSGPWGEGVYMQTLKAIVPVAYILSADRRLDSDDVADPSDEIELRRVMRYEDARSINDLAARSREIALTQALMAAGRWMSKNALQSANQGTENVHSVYGNVLRHLSATSAPDESAADPDVARLVKQLNSVEIRSAEYAQYELTTSLSTLEFRKALATRSKPKRALSANLLRPYIDSLEGRLNAIQPIYQLINGFVLTVNSLLSDKTIVYKLSQGFTFQNRNKDFLEPGHLSSGEQQLLLLFCNVLMARDKPSLFMIDEPEISLNIKWQRQLIQALLSIVDDARVQFIFASHSIELLSQHRNNVVKLVNSQ